MIHLDKAEKEAKKSKTAKPKTKRHKKFLTKRRTKEKSST